MSDPPVVTPPIVIGPVGLLDCSPEAQAERLLLLRDLRARAYGGVTQVTDRNRSVTYQSPQQLWAAIAMLGREVAACEMGRWPAERRVYYVPQVKDL